MSAPISALERCLAATTKRNFERPIVHYDAFAAARIPATQRAALEFLIVNMEYIERTSTPNLAAIAAGAPVAAVAACFKAQIEDEVAHATMLGCWLNVAKHSGVAHRATRFGVRAAEVYQHHAWLGIKNAEILTEHYASNLIAELIPRVDEPCLKFVLAEIQKDEQRHKIIAIESVRALLDGGHHRGFIARLFGPIVEHGTVLYFRHVFGGFLTKQAAALELPAAAIMEKTLDEVHDALRESRSTA